MPARWIGAAVAIVVLVAVVVVCASLLRVPTYEASAEVRLGLQKQSYGRIRSLSAPGPAKNMAQEIPIIIDSHPMAKEAIRRLGLGMSPEELLNHLTARQVESSRFIRLSYTDTDPVRARQVVGTVGQVSSEYITQTGVASFAGHLTATVDEARAPHEPVSPKPLRNGLLALVVGLALVSAAAIARARRGPPPPTSSRP